MPASSGASPWTGGAFQAPISHIGARTALTLTAAALFTFLFGLVVIWDVVIANRMPGERWCYTFDSLDDLEREAEATASSPDYGRCSDGPCTGESREVHRIIWPDINERTTNPIGCAP